MRTSGDCATRFDGDRDAVIKVQWIAAATALPVVSASGNGFGVATGTLESA